MYDNFDFMEIQVIPSVSRLYVACVNNRKLIESRKAKYQLPLIRFTMKTTKCI